MIKFIVQVLWFDCGDGDSVLLEDGLPVFQLDAPELCSNEEELEEFMCGVSPDHIAQIWEVPATGYLVTGSPIKREWDASTQKLVPLENV